MKNINSSSWKISVNLLPMFLLVVIALIGAFLLQGCSDKSVSNSESPAVTDKSSPFTSIDDYIVYDNDTFMVYYMFSTNQQIGAYYGFGYGYMSPYLIDGKTCKYVGGKIVPLD